MAYYAQIVDNIVTEVIVVDNDIPDGEQFCTNLLGGTWIQTYINNPSKNYAGVGYTYDPATNNFNPPPDTRPDIK